MDLRYLVDEFCSWMNKLVLRITITQEDIFPRLLCVSPPNCTKREKANGAGVKWDSWRVSSCRLRGSAGTVFSCQLASADDVDYECLWREDQNIQLLMSSERLLKITYISSFSISFSVECTRHKWASTARRILDYRQVDIIPPWPQQNKHTRQRHQESP